jgi:hypothetical protein
MLGETKSTPSAEEPAAEPETSETAAGEPQAEEKPEAAAETADTKTDPEKSDEEPLPPGVQKRLAKEAEKAARAQAAIDRAVSERKAKEAEAAKLTAGEKGSEPVKSPQSPDNQRPQRPQLGEKGHESETWAQFQAREAAYEEAHDKWVRSETLKEFKEQQQAEATKRADIARWDAAVKEHGADFPKQVEAVRAVAPEGLQNAIGDLENWSGVAVHLASNPAKLQELSQAFQQNPTRAIATLGRIEAALTKKESKPATTTTEKPLPEPLKKVGGSASASGQDLQSQLETGSMASVKALVGKIRSRK